MSVSGLKIELFNSTAVYFSGDTILGSVTFTVEERLKINRVRLSVIGYGKVFWYINLFYINY